jgi:hypothetical protein
MNILKQYISEAIKLKLNTGKNELEKNTKFVNDFLNSGFRSPFDNRMAVFDIDGAHVQFTMQPSRDSVYLASIMVMNTEMKTGAGTKAMKKLIDMADKQGVTLRLVAKPIKSPTGKKIPANKLINWYKTLGFKSTDNVRDNMVRTPK